MMFHHVGERECGVAHLGEQVLIFVEIVVAGGVGLVPADPGIDERRRTRWNHLHVCEPVGQHAAQIFRPRGVAVRDDRERASGEMLGIAPAFELQLLWPAADFLPFVVVGSGLPPSAHTSRSIMSFRLAGAWYQCTGQRIITPCAAHPARINLVHPVVDLPHGVIGITGAWPMAQRLRR